MLSLSSICSDSFHQSVMANCKPCQVLGIILDSSHKQSMPHSERAGKSMETTENQDILPQMVSLKQIKKHEKQVETKYCVRARLWAASSQDP